MRGSGVETADFHAKSFGLGGALMSPFRSPVEKDFRVLTLKVVVRLSCCNWPGEQTSTT
jgi:hypothetical protein